MNEDLVAISYNIMNKLGKYNGGVSQLFKEQTEVRRSRMPWSKTDFEVFVLWESKDRNDIIFLYPLEEQDTE